MRINLQERRYRFPFLSIVLLMITGTVVLLLATALEAIPRLRHTQQVALLSTLEWNGVLQTQDVEQETYWTVHRRLQKPSSSFSFTALNEANQVDDHHELGVRQHVS